MLKYFVSTHRTQGERVNDSNSIPGPEIVDLASLSHEDPDSPICGCARSFVGISSRQTSTTAEVVESDMTAAEYIGRFHAGLLALGWKDNVETRNGVIDAAVELLLLAAMWPVGTVVERRLHEIRVRSFPKES
ncbi:hypothetical protein [Amycolatopsis sp. DG1A-15b]|uniref:DUF7715 family protein n=1 Tax=Amycolatopsis sp. DG1A-15b TaxID=3052846 RepID=UPI00255C013B|nr:hypothetical protein [Amycolatopsis sp. DG1A-15b]WIX85758.1 hypothetical protein QRY02_31710 [Amycolatopsis sp. DG1A-15b]